MIIGGALPDIVEQVGAGAVGAGGLCGADDVEAKVELADELLDVGEQGLEVLADALCGNLHDGKGGEARLGHVSDAEDVVVEVVELGRQGVGLRGLEIRRQRLAAGNRGREQRQQGGDFAACATGVVDQTAKVEQPLRLRGCVFLARRVQ